MKSFIVVALFIAAAVAAPAGPGSEKEAVILRYESDNIGLEGYNYAVETSNGINQQETGQVTNPGTDDEGIEVRGQYSYPGPDGVVYTVTYIANKDGFQPKGAHLPDA